MEVTLRAPRSDYEVTVTTYTELYDLLALAYVEVVPEPVVEPVVEPEPVKPSDEVVPKVEPKPDTPESPGPASRRVKHQQ